ALLSWEVADDLQQPAGNDRFRFTLTDDDRLHGTVLRLQPDMPLLAVKAFQGRLVINQRHDDLPVLSGRLGGNQGQIAIEDIRFDHAVAFDPQKKTPLVVDPRHVQVVVTLDILDCRLRTARTHPSDDRDGYGARSAGKGDVP